MVEKNRDLGLWAINKNLFMAELNIQPMQIFYTCIIDPYIHSGITRGHITQQE
jgi:hypothetical protein